MKKRLEAALPICIGRSCRLSNNVTIFVTDDALALQAWRFRFAWKSP